MDVPSNIFRDKNNSLVADPAAYPCLVGDIGGTNARFALVEAAGAPPSSIQVLPGADYASLVDAVNAYLAPHARRPRWASLGIANPLDGDWVSMTNHHWAFSARQTCQDLGLERLILLNDFTALALGVPTLGEAQLRRVGSGASVRRPGNLAILGPGTGLGASGLVPVGGGYVPVTGEGGHVTLPAMTEEEVQIVAWLRQRLPHVSAERVLSGPGLVWLYRALAALRGVTLEAAPSAAEVTRMAHAGDALGLETVQFFGAFLGTVAGDLALTLGAAGGLFISGGVVPAMGELFHASPFRERFEAKGRFKDYLARIPTYVIHAPYCAIEGAANAIGLDALPGCLDVRL